MVRVSGGIGRHDPEKILQELLKHGDNRRCVDCDALVRHEYIYNVKMMSQLRGVASCCRDLTMLSPSSVCLSVPTVVEFIDSSDIGSKQCLLAHLPSTK